MTPYEKDILEQIYDCAIDEDECDDWQRLKHIRVLANILLKKTPRLDFMESTAFDFVYKSRKKIKIGKLI